MLLVRCIPFFIHRAPYLLHIGLPAYGCISLSPCMVIYAYAMYIYYLGTSSPPHVLVPSSHHITSSPRRAISSSLHLFTTSSPFISWRGFKSAFRCIFAFGFISSYGFISSSGYICSSRFCLNAHPTCDACVPVVETLIGGTVPEHSTNPCFSLFCALHAPVSLDASIYLLAAFAYLLLPVHALPLISLYGHALMSSSPHLLIMPSPDPLSVLQIVHEHA